MPPSATHPYRVAADGLRVHLRLQPAARSDEVTGLAELDDGSTVLKVRVTAAPEKGKANAALIKLLAKNWGVAKSDLSIVAGWRDRRKTVLVQGASASLLPKLDAWLKSLPTLAQDQR